MKIIYRISDTGYKKEKPTYITNENCLKNALNAFPTETWHVIADNVGADTTAMLEKYIDKDFIQYVSVGHGAGTFNIALDNALTLPDNEIVYFLENDYVHKYNSDLVLKEGIETGADFVSLYDHPDKYLDPSQGGNPFCHGGAEETRVYRTKSIHWKLTNSTTMTFAARVKTLRENEEVLRQFTASTHPDDFQMFLELRKRGKSLITPIPGYSTHGETAWLAPGIDWEGIIKI